MTYLTRSKANRGRGRRSGAFSSVPATVAEAVPARSSALADDSASGRALFLLFVTAVLVVTAGVALLALLGSWWALGFVFGLHVLATFVVGAAIFTVMSDGKLTLRGANRDKADFPSPVEAPTQAEAVHSYPIAA